MSVYKITSRYAKSLIDQAKQKDKLEAIVEDAKTFVNMAESKDFSVFLKSPIIHSDKKWQVFQALFAGKVQEESLDFFKMVIQKGRENVLTLIMSEVISIYKKMIGTTTVTLTVASEMSDKEFDKISAKLKSSGLASENVDFIHKIDPAIIGGFVIKIGDKQYDASIAGKMKKLRKELI